MCTSFPRSAWERTRGRSASKVNALINVTITNRQKTLPIDRRCMRRVVKAIVRDAGIADGQIGIAVVDDATIAKLHNEYLSDPEPTDVLSFVLDSSPGYIEGEVVVSADTAIASAPRFKSSAASELLLYVIHGTLHLVGYDDTTSKKRATMRRHEKEYLAMEIATHAHRKSHRHRHPHR